MSQEANSGKTTGICLDILSETPEAVNEEAARVMKVTFSLLQKSP